MKYSEAKPGRIFVIRLEDGDIIHHELEQFAKEKSITGASLIILGGADKGSRLVVGPEHGRAETIVPMVHELEDVHEICGTGTLFPDDEGTPVLHMHISCGRKNSAVSGCIREGVKAWHVLEVILYELKDSTAVREIDPVTGFKLLKP